MKVDFHEEYRPAVTAAPSNRSTGYVFAAASLIIGIVNFRNPVILSVGIALSLAFGIVSTLAPAMLQPLALAWFALGRLLHRIISPVILGALFWVVILPFGLFMRIGYDPLQARRSRDRKSYWITPNVHAGDAALDSMKNQY